MDNYIVGRNAVKEALKAGRSIQRILVSDDKIKTGLSDIVGLAKSKGVEVRPTPVKQMNRYETDVPVSYRFIRLKGAGRNSTPLDFASLPIPDKPLLLSSFLTKLRSIQRTAFFSYFTAVYPTISEYMSHAC